MTDARKHKFSVVIVAAFDFAMSTKHFLSVVNELDSLGIGFMSRRENVDTGGPMGCFFTALIGSLAEAEKSILAERIKSGMRRAKLEGQRLGRTPLDIDHAALVRDRLSGMSLTACSKRYSISRASVIRFCREVQRRENAVVQFEPTAADKRLAAQCIA
jgi:DNA invertase Pin-like site-specific DNA recombinase